MIKEFFTVNEIKKILYGLWHNSPEAKDIIKKEFDIGDMDDIDMGDVGDLFEKL